MKRWFFIWFYFVYLYKIYALSEIENGSISLLSQFQSAEYVFLVIYRSNDTFSINLLHQISEVEEAFVKENRHKIRFSQINENAIESLKNQYTGLMPLALPECFLLSKDGKAQLYQGRRSQEAINLWLRRRIERKNWHEITGRADIAVDHKTPFVLLYKDSVENTNGSVSLSKMQQNEELVEMLAAVDETSTNYYWTKDYHTLSFVTQNNQAQRLIESCGVMKSMMIAKRQEQINVFCITETTKSVEVALFIQKSTKILVNYYQKKNAAELFTFSFVQTYVFLFMSPSMTELEDRMVKVAQHTGLAHVLFSNEEKTIYEFLDLPKGSFPLISIVDLSEGLKTVVFPVRGNELIRLMERTNDEGECLLVALVRNFEELYIARGMKYRTIRKKPTTVLPEELTLNADGRVGEEVNKEKNSTIENAVDKESQDRVAVEEKNATIESMINAVSKDKVAVDMNKEKNVTKESVVDLENKVVDPVNSSLNASMPIFNSSITENVTSEDLPQLSNVSEIESDIVPGTDKIAEELHSSNDSAIDMPGGTEAFEQTTHTSIPEESAGGENQISQDISASLPIVDNRDVNEDSLETSANKTVDAPQQDTESTEDPIESLGDLALDNALSNEEEIDHSNLKNESMLKDSEENINTSINYNLSDSKKFQGGTDMEKIVQEDIDMVFGNDGRNDKEGSLGIEKKNRISSNTEETDSAILFKENTNHTERQRENKEILIESDPFNVESDLENGIEDDIDDIFGREGKNEEEANLTITETASFKKNVVQESGSAIVSEKSKDHPRDANEDTDTEKRVNSEADGRDDPPDNLDNVSSPLSMDDSPNLEDRKTPITSPDAKDTIPFTKQSTDKTVSNTDSPIRGLQNGPFPASYQEGLTTKSGLKNLLNKKDTLDIIVEKTKSILRDMEMKSKKVSKKSRRKRVKETKKKTLPIVNIPLYVPPARP